MNKKILLAGLVVLGMAGCATEAKYRDYMNSWKGASEAELTEAKGIPDGSYEQRERKYLTYNTQDGEDYCKSVFVLEKYSVLKWESSGNNCVSSISSRNDDMDTSKIAE